MNIALNNFISNQFLFSEKTLNSNRQFPSFINNQKITSCKFVKFNFFLIWQFYTNNKLLFYLSTQRSLKLDIH